MDLGAFQHPQRAAAFPRSWRALSASLPVDALIALVVRHADPDRVLEGLDHVLRQAPALAARLRGSAEAEAAAPLVRFLAGSHVLGDELVADAALCELLVENPADSSALDAALDSWDAELRRGLAAAALNPVGEDEAKRLLRRYRRKAFVAVGWLDLALHADLEAVTARLSAVADHALDAARWFAETTLSARYGAPRDDRGAPLSGVILALGKLGGMELNYSSDIDVVWLCSDLGAAHQDGATLPSATWFLRWAQLITRVLSEVTEDGYVFRVDSRLKPGGTIGSLVPTFREAEHWFFSRGSAWERQAYLKARVAAGDAALGARFLEALRPFVYPRYLTQASVTELKQVKRRAERELARRGGEGYQIKAGEGGIRDIEAVAQFLQLVNGGVRPELRTPNTLQALDRLSHAGLLTAAECRDLDAAYRFLRTLEHRLMLVYLHKAHRMPADPGEEDMLARRMGFFSDPDDAPSPGEPRPARARLHHALSAHRAAVRQTLRRFFIDRFEDARRDEAALVLDPNLSDAEAEALLAPYGFAEIPRTRGIIARMVRHRQGGGVSLRAAQFLADALPALLRALRDSRAPDATLTRLESITQNLGAPSIWYQMLAQNRQMLDVFVDVCASPLLADLLIPHPELVDEFFDLLQTDHRHDAGSLSAALDERLTQTDPPRRALHEFRALEFLRVGVRALQRAANLRNTTEYLSVVAQVLVNRVLAQALCERGADQATTPFAVLALGKFGSAELSYGSDLDLMFLYDPDWPQAPVDEPALAFFPRLAATVQSRLSETTEWGRLYAVDARLRPMGSKNPLAVSLDELRRYYQHREAHTWERLALARARVVAGSPAFAERVEALTAEILNESAGTRLPRGEIRAFRARIEALGGPGDIKRGAGGLIDIEFLAHTLALERGVGPPGKRLTGTIALLESLRDDHRLPGAACEHLMTAYEFLRSLEVQAQLAGQGATPRFDESLPALATLAAHLGYQDGSGRDLLREIRYHQRRVRALFDTLCAG